ncbi:MAG: ABC transporter permease [Lachnospiraceae bacterium]|nr:ABC transporter permease [Lachnospiraceae bacterium]
MRGMFQNSNAGLERELAAEDYKAHSVRNRMAILAVALTTILICVVFTVGIGFIKAVTLSFGASPGPGADSCSIYGDEEVLAKVRELPQVDWAAYVKRCSTTYLHNREFSGLEVRLFAADKVHYDKNMVELIAGDYPQKADEILLSDTMSKRLGLGEEIGAEYSLTVVIQGEEEEIEQVIPMTVCGYYKNPLKNISNFYEEIYTGNDFIQNYNPLLAEGYDQIYVKLNNLAFYKLGRDRDEKLDEVNTLVGGNGSGYKMSDMNGGVMALIFLIVLIIMFCGYIFIYNVFDISIVNDIRFYGELKTIGMTAGQLRRMLFYQMNRIAVWGIVIGTLIGYGVGRFAGRSIVSRFADGIAMYYQPAGIVEAFVLSAAFAWITVYISTKRPFRTVCTISPVEASKYRGKQKKGVFSVLSFGISGILFLLVYTLSAGYNVDVMMERYNETDFRISHKAAIWMQEEAYRPVSQELIVALEEQALTENFSLIYQARTKPDFFVWNGIHWYEASLGEIGKEGELAADIRSVNDNLMKKGNDKVVFPENERGNYRVSIIGVSPEYLARDEKYMEILEGAIEPEKFAGGDYMIYRRLTLGGKEQSLALTEEMDDQVHAGDKVTVPFYDDVAQRYVERTYTVMAIVADDWMFGTPNTKLGNIIISDREFCSIYSDYENLVSRICFDASEKFSSADLEEGKEQYETVAELLEADGNLQLKLDAKYQDGVEFMEEKKTITIFGMFLAVIVGLIGIANLINTVTTDVMARKLEYAAMQSIGMTGKQMERDISTKYARYIFISVGLAAIFGTLLTYLVAASPVFTGFSLLAFMQAFLIFLLFSIVLCMVMARILTKAMNRKSIVERLREVV